MKKYLLFALAISLLLTSVSFSQTQSLKFFGNATEGVVIPANEVLNRYSTTNQITITSWVKFDSLKGYSRIFNKTRGLCQDDIGLEIDSIGSLYFGYYGSCTGSSIAKSSPNYFQLNMWYHVAGVIDGRPEQRKIKIFINGQQVGVSNMNSNYPTANFIPVVLGNNRHWNGLNSNAIKGKLCEIQYYNIALSQAEIQNRMNRYLVLSSSDTTGLIGYWKLNGNANDFSKYQNNGAVEGPSQFVADHPFINHPTITWKSTIKCNDSGTGLDSLQFGTASLATNGIDTLYGETELPPVPPSTVFDYRFTLPTTPALPSKKDFRNDTNKTITWRMTFQPSASGYPMTFNWNSALLPQGSFFLKDEVTGTIVNVNMKTQNSYTLTNSGITSLKIEYSENITVPVIVSNDWNIVSVPVNAVNMSVSDLFPGSTSQAYGFNNGYVTSTTLSTGKGYFLKFGIADTLSIIGTTISPKEIPVVSGWNMIGPFESSVPVSSITSTPPGIVSSLYYGYSNGYQSSTTLNPGKGYWVKTTQAGTLLLPSSLMGIIADNKLKQNTSNFDNILGWTRIRITDAKNNNTLLYLAKSNEITSSYELPPVPPQGIFDARFESNYLVEASGKNHGIKITSAEYPIQISAESLKGMNLRLRDKVTGKIINEELTEGKIITVYQPIETFDIIDDNALPTTYNLEQNYPNPFNPVTTIKYQIPNQGVVTLRIYDVLGREVNTLVNQYQQAGYYTVKFDATGFASGVYFYKLTAGNYTAVKKLVVNK